MILSNFVFTNFSFKITCVVWKRQQCELSMVCKLHCRIRIRKWLVFWYRVWPTIRYRLVAIRSSFCSSREKEWRSRACTPQSRPWRNQTSNPKKSKKIRKSFGASEASAINRIPGVLTSFGHKYIKKCPQIKNFILNLLGHQMIC